MGRLWSPHPRPLWEQTDSLTSTPRDCSRSDVQLVVRYFAQALEIVQLYILVLQYLPGTYLRGAQFLVRRPTPERSGRPTERGALENFRRRDRYSSCRPAVALTVDPPSYFDTARPLKGGGRFDYYVGPQALPWFRLGSVLHSTCLNEQWRLREARSLNGTRLSYCNWIERRKPLQPKPPCLNSQGRGAVFVSMHTTPQDWHACLAASGR